MENLTVVIKQIHETTPQNEVDWLSVIPIIVSIIALIVAIAIPVYIARKQNKIALFEKRFAAYSELLKIKSFAAMLNGDEVTFVDITTQESEGYLDSFEFINQLNLVRSAFGAVFNNLPEKSGDLDSLQIAIFSITSVELSVQSLPFLYSRSLKKVNKEFTDELHEICVALRHFMAEILIQPGTVDDNYRTNYIDGVDNFMTKYMNIVEKPLKI